ncbi:aminopeptidase [Pseudovibrio japonicus]|uniref:Aminopeptidase n=1 Tax=Pseudovibrio japonicus TaxID=366534 RepID=A0ABQ3E6Q4_9HYPH|nr:DUF805 domain-containing protein [Pseudovibrio japonicus]GHB22862.1 aminopeptidase [Pseudovibrio japonicus]
MVTFHDAITTCFRKYAKFYGRAPRSEYWWWALFSILMSALATSIDIFLFELIFGAIPLYGQQIPSPLATAVAIVLLLPGLAVSVRRLHDVNYSGYWLFLWLVPVIGWLFLLYLHLRPSEETVLAEYQ